MQYSTPKLHQLEFYRLAGQNPGITRSFYTDAKNLFGTHEKVFWNLNSCQPNSIPIFYLNPKLFSAVNSLTRINNGLRLNLIDLLLFAFLNIFYIRKNYYTSKIIIIINRTKVYKYY